MAALYEQHAAMVLAICRRLLRDPSEAEDAAQQTFLSAQRALGNGSQPREPAAWLATIARNECVTRSRARRREPQPTDAEPTAASLDAHADAERRQRVESLRDAIGSLPEQQRDAILLREVRGLSYDEVAASLALSPSAVESLLFRARKGLQLRLRNAWAALSPLGWVTAVRDLSTQAVAGGDPGVGPAAAKAVAIGLGTAVIAGGALIGPGARVHDQRAAAPRAPVPKAAPRHAPAQRAGQRATSPTPAPTPTPTAARPARRPAAADTSLETSRPRSTRQHETGSGREDRPTATPRPVEDGAATALPAVWSTPAPEHEGATSAGTSAGEHGSRKTEAAGSGTRSGSPSGTGSTSEQPDEPAGTTVWQSSGSGHDGPGSGGSGGDGSHDDGGGD